jgi:glucokinase
MDDCLQRRRPEPATAQEIESRSPVIGVDIGGTEVKAGIVDFRGGIVHEIRCPTRAGEGVDVVLGQIRKAISDLLTEAGSDDKSVAGIGVGCPGLVDSREGLVRVPPNFPGWREVPLREHIHRAFDLPTVVVNDVNAMAIGELHYGAGRGYRDVICLTLGTGVGGAVIFNRQLHTGFLGTAGEIGHMTVEPNGPQCNCGNRGCLERMIGSQAIIERTLSKVRNWGGHSSVSSLGAAEVEPKSIAAAARAGDELALQVFQEVGDILGIVLAGLVNLLNPEAIIIGGGVATAGDLLLKPVRETVRRRSYALPGERVDILPAQLGNRAGIVGAATVVFSLSTHRT